MNYNYGETCVQQCTTPWWWDDISIGYLSYISTNVTRDDGQRLCEWKTHCETVYYYTDNPVLVASTPSALQTLATVIKNDCRRKDLQLNAKKTKIIVLEIEEKRTCARIDKGGTVLEKVKEIIYLGGAFDKDGRLQSGRKAIC